jgi:hypothetical protein
MLGENSPFPVLASIHLRGIQHATSKILAIRALAHARVAFTQAEVYTCR